LAVKQTDPTQIEIFGREAGFEQRLDIDRFIERGLGRFGGLGRFDRFDRFGVLDPRGT
jgi:hypothetical protein